MALNPSSGRSRRASGCVPAHPAVRQSVASRGQMLVLFVITIFVLTGITAIVVDVSWYWANSLRVQRAADAAALAGVVWLPGDPSTAYATARDEATKNGYDDGIGGVIVTPLQDAGNKRRLNVTISGAVGTFFMRIFGIPRSTARPHARRPSTSCRCPMGSPRELLRRVRPDPR